MPEYGGLQIEARCVRCGRLPTASITLFEMQNHLYICDICREKEEQRGKLFTWVNGLQAETPRTITLPLTPTTPLSASSGMNSTTTTLSANLPPDSVFGGLGLPLDTSVAKIGEAIKQQTAIWMKKPVSAEQKQMVARLRQWREELQNESRFEERREALKMLSRSGNTLSVGGRMVWDAQEFLNACEASQAGWSDGERYLRNGKLWQWILYQLEDREMAMRGRYYRNWTDVSDFRALNEMLYCLVSTRPFRLYSDEKWQERDTVPSAKTREELAQLCDTYWGIAEKHLYSGSMGFWLEYNCGIAGLSVYYQKCVAGYATQWADQGVGLELFLEHAVPALEKPRLVVSFDGTKGSYKEEGWDREIPHKSIPVTITNETRGFTSLDIVLQPAAEITEPGWITFNGRTPVRGRPGAGMPVTFSIALTNLNLLKRNSTYSRNLTISAPGEYGSKPDVKNYPITLKTMWFFQGLRGILWRYGLRGGIPGLAWNFLAATLLALVPFLLIPALVPGSYFNWSIQQGTGSFGSAFFEALAAGMVQYLSFSQPLLAFPWMVGIIMGIVGYRTGWGQGHTNYTENSHASGLRKGAFWLSLLFAAVLVYFTGGPTVISQAVQASGNGYLSDSYKEYLLISSLQVVGDAILVLLLVFFIACILAAIERRLERVLRERNKALLNPVGRV